MNTLEEEKRTLRKLIKEQKERLTPSEIQQYSRCIFTKIEGLPEFCEANTIMAYWALPDEVQTQDFILHWYQHKHIVLPVVDGFYLRLKEFTGINNMTVSNHFGIEEPNAEDFVHPEKIQMVIVPGIAFDKQNNRLGRGKAYYDRFLMSIRTFKIGVCFPFQLLPHIPAGPEDIKMDIVITC
ncbi:MAG: 5-formyltetrahydrofolate cyclo-ligase [Lentimicrobium sp.]